MSTIDKVAATLTCILIFGPLGASLHFHFENHVIAAQTSDVINSLVFLAMLLQAWVFHRQLVALRGQQEATEQAAKTSKEALLTGIRAWLKPAGVVAATELTIGQPFTIQLALANIGREPALQVFWHIDCYGIDYIPVSDSQITAIDAQPNDCESRIIVREGTGVVIYPQDGKWNNWLPYTIGTNQKDLDMLARVFRREQSLVVEGAFSYYTAGETKFSWFRFFYRDKLNQPCKEWMFNLMLSGNNAT